MSIHWNDFKSYPVDTKCYVGTGKKYPFHCLWAEQLLVIPSKPFHFCEMDYQHLFFKTKSIPKQSCDLPHPFFFLDVLVALVTAN